jgi:Sulfotransferase family
MAPGTDQKGDWTAHGERLLRLSQCQLFFVGGAPRSGTTWLQYLLDSHPEVSCRGEGLFMKHLAEPLEAMMTARRQVLAAKNASVFRHADGYQLPEPEDVEFLLGTAILTALERQSAGKACRAVGEKTPENVFFFAQLKRLFPAAKFIGISRDPRDVLSSAWHFFPRPPAKDEIAAKTAFISSALASLDNGARTTLALAEQFPSDCMNVTYERMSAATAPVAAQLFRFLGVADGDDIVADCVARTSFAALSGGRSPGAAQDGSFFRKGVVGDWRETFTPEMNALIQGKLGWMYRHFGWVP